MRTRGTKRPCDSRRSTESACRLASDEMEPQMHPSVAVDGLVLRSGKLVAVRRKNEPFRGMPALPGGVVQLGERTEDAVGRAVREETGPVTEENRLGGVFSNPGTSPRANVISIPYAM